MNKQKTKRRVYIPIKRAEVFQDRRERRQRTRNTQNKQAIKESSQ